MATRAQRIREIARRKRGIRALELMYTCIGKEAYARKETTGDHPLYAAVARVCGDGLDCLQLEKDDLRVGEEAQVRPRKAELAAAGWVAAATCTRDVEGEIRTKWDEYFAPLEEPMTGVPTATYIMEGPPAGPATMDETALSLVMFIVTAVNLHQEAH